LQYLEFLIKYKLTIKIGESPMENHQTSEVILKIPPSIAADMGSNDKRNYECQQY
jgi:hypothetical protein